jgi:hypothetical protein
MASNSYNNSTYYPYDRYNQVPPVECNKLTIIGVFCILLFFSSIFFNFSLLWIFFKNRELRTSVNIFIITLTIINILGTLLETPWIVFSNLFCRLLKLKCIYLTKILIKKVFNILIIYFFIVLRWVYGKIGCLISGFGMYFIGCSSVYIFTAVSFERHVFIFF